MDTEAQFYHYTKNMIRTCQASNEKVEKRVIHRLSTCFSETNSDEVVGKHQHSLLFFKSGMTEETIYCM